jgi:hypothetical protein
MILAIIFTAAAVTFTWGWDVMAILGHPSATATRRLAAGTSCLTLLVGLLLLRSGRDLAQSFLDQQRRDGLVPARSAERMNTRNRRFLVGVAVALVASALAGFAFAAAS